MAEKTEKKSDSGKESRALAKPPRLLTELAEAAGLDESRYFNVIINTVLKKRGRDREMVRPSNEEVYAFLMVCRKYDLDPLLKQIHGFVGKDGQIVPIVGIDGWVKIALGNDQYVTHRTTSVLQDEKTGAIVKIMENPETGMRDFYIEPEGAKVDLSKLKPIYSVTAFERKGSKGWVIGEPEWFSECVRSTDPWGQMPRRMLAHKSFMQAARKAFGIGGIHDQDEALDIERTQEDGRARAIIDAPIPSDEEPDRKALEPPVGAGNIEEHTGHQDETGAAEKSAVDLREARGEPATDPAPPQEPETPKDSPGPSEQPDLPSATADPGYVRLGDINKSIYAKVLRTMHAARKQAGWSEDDFKKMYKGRYKVASVTKMTMNQANELRKWLTDNPKPQEKTDAAPPTEQAETPSTEAGPEKAETQTKEQDEIERQKWIEALGDYQQMFPSDFKQLLQDEFLDKKLKDLNLEELKRFNTLLEKRMDEKQD